MSRSRSSASGSYFPDWLLERRKRAESALISVVATCYLLGVSTRRMDKLVQTLGITSLSKSQVSRMAADLDEQVEAIAANLPGTTWQRCRTHYAANLMSVTPKSSWGWVKAQLHSVYDQPEAGAVHAQFDRVVDALVGKRPAVAEHLMVPAPRYWHSPPSPANCGLRSGRIIPTNGSTAKYAGAQMLSASPRARRHHRTGRRCPGRTTRRMG